MLSTLPRCRAQASSEGRDTAPRRRGVRASPRRMAARARSPRPEVGLVSSSTDDDAAGSSALVEAGVDLSAPAAAAARPAASSSAGRSWPPLSGGSAAMRFSISSSSLCQLAAAEGRATASLRHRAAAGRSLRAVRSPARLCQALAYVCGDADGLESSVRTRLHCGLAAVQSLLFTTNGTAAGAVTLFEERLVHIPRRRVQVDHRQRNSSSKRCEARTLSHASASAQSCSASLIKDSFCSAAALLLNIIAANGLGDACLSALVYRSIASSHFSLLKAALPSVLSRSASASDAVVPGQVKNCQMSWDSEKSALMDVSSVASFVTQNELFSTHRGCPSRRGSLTRCADRSLGRERGCC